MLKIMLEFKCMKRQRNNTHKEKSAESADLGRFQVPRGILASREMDAIGHCCSGSSLCHIRK